MEKGNETEARREEAKSEGKIGDIQEKEEVDMGDEKKKGQEEAMEEDEERVEEREVNKRAESLVEALNVVEMRDDTHANP